MQLDPKQKIPTPLKRYFLSFTQKSVTLEFPFVDISKIQILHYVIRWNRYFQKFNYAKVKYCHRFNITRWMHSSFYSCTSSQKSTKDQHLISPKINKNLNPKGLCNVMIYIAPFRATIQWVSHYKELNKNSRKSFA